MPRNAGDVPRNTSAPHLAETEDGGKKRSERLRARRDEAGLAQVSGWVPKDRRPYAREVLAALAQGANSLPPDPEQAETLKTAQAALQAAQAEATAARVAEAAACEALLLAEERGQVLAAELEAARAEIETARDGACQAELAALAQVEAARTAAALALEAVERFQKAPGLRGQAIRWLTR